MKSMEEVILGIPTMGGNGRSPRLLAKALKDEGYIHKSQSHESCLDEKELKQFLVSELASILSHSTVEVPTVQHICLASLLSEAIHAKFSKPLDDK